MSEDTVLFVCLHGAAKSLIAASHLERLAGERGMAVRAAFAGTEPDPELTPAAVAGLLAEGIDVRGHRPRRVTGDDIARAARVVSFGCELAALAPGVAVERWDDVPAVSDDYRVARDMIVSRLAPLLASVTSEHRETHVGGMNDHPEPPRGSGAMDATELLRTRHSALKLGEPRPSAHVVQAMLESVARVPDHGRLQPWSVILIDGDARLDFGEVLAEALSRRNPSADQQALSREREKALRAPLIIVVATRCDRSAKIPIIEQILSAGCAAHSIMLAAFAQGLGAMWKTGEAAYDNAVKRALAIEPDDLIVGFIYVGTDLGGPGIRPPRTPQEFARHWSGGNAKPPSS